jgi:tetratricopeptide (TPR) repeat protein
MSAPSDNPLGTAPRRARRLSPAFAAAFLVLAGLAAYSNCYSGAFVYDDNDSIVPNPAIRHLWPPGPFLKLGGRQVVELSFAVNYAIGGLNVVSYHAFNLAIHILAALTLFGVVRRTLTSPALSGKLGDASVGLALAVALLWEVHPLQTESVTYIVQRAESLAGLFYLLTLYCFIRAASSPGGESLSRKDTRTPGTATDLSFPGLPPHGWRASLAACWSKRWYAAAVLACAVGAGCKPTIATAPVVLLLYDRAFLSGSFRKALRRHWGMYFALAATWLLVFPSFVMAVSDRGSSAGFQLPVAPAVYALTQLGVVLHYLRLAFWPHPLCLDYCWPAAGTPADVLPGAVVIGLLLAGTAALLVLRPAWGFPGAWFFLILAPTSSFMPIADAAVEHRMYLPLAAVIAAVVIGGYALLLRLTPARATERASAALVLLVAAALGGLTFRRNEDYRSELRIWEDTIQKRPDDPRAYNGRGVVLLREGEYKPAIRDFGIAIEKGPGYAAAYQNRAAAEAGIGENDAAIRDCDAAIGIKLDFALAYDTRAVARAQKGDYAAALADFDRAIRLKPSYAKGRYNRGNAYLATRDYDHAIADYDSALTLESMPDCAPVYANRGAAYIGKGDYDQAIRDFTSAIEIQPGYLEAYNNRAGAYYLKKEYRNAWADIETVLTLGGQPSPDLLRALRAASPEAK